MSLMIERKIAGQANPRLHRWPATRALLCAGGPGATGWLSVEAGSGGKAHVAAAKKEDNIGFNRLDASEIERFPGQLGIDSL